MKSFFSKSFTNFPFLLLTLSLLYSFSIIKVCLGFSPSFSFGNSLISSRRSSIVKRTFALQNKNRENLHNGFLNNNYLHHHIQSTASTLRLTALKKSGEGAKKDGEVSFETMDGSGVRIGIVRARWNPTIIDNLDSGIKKALTECNVKEENIFETSVPGSWELPLAVRFLAMSRQCDVIIAVGCLIKGETMHFEYIADSVSKGLMDVQLQSTIPCIFGVLTTMTEAQAKDRSTGDNNHGYSWGMAAVEMALLRSDALKPVPQRGTLDLVGQNEKNGSKGESDTVEKESEKEVEKKEKKPFGF